ncbi:MAG: threonine/serine dehydratase [Gemmatimonadaceae bacterium]
MPTIEQISSARERISHHLHVTPVTSASLLGKEANVALFLKCENLQKTGSFKPRGALNKVCRLDAAARRRGVVTVSAGNHAQALAWAARTANVRATVVMPRAASQAKADASAAYGAEVVRHGTTFEAFERAQALASERGLVFVHPFDDEEVMAGAGTTGLEILEQVAEVDAVVVPIGGGGLIGGVAAAIKQLRPAVRVYGVEPRGAAAMRSSLDAGRAVRLQAVDTIADGLAAPMAGALTYDVVQRYVDDVVLVSDDEITSAVRALLSRAKLLAEPAGAAAVAAILARRLALRDGENVVAVVSGGNVDLARLKEML